LISTFYTLVKKRVEYSFWLVLGGYVRVYVFLGSQLQPDCGRGVCPCFCAPEKGRVCRANTQGHSFCLSSAQAAAGRIPRGRVQKVNEQGGSRESAGDVQHDARSHGRHRQAWKTRLPAASSPLSATGMIGLWGRWMKQPAGESLYDDHRGGRGRQEAHHIIHPWVLEQSQRVESAAETCTTVDRAFDTTPSIEERPKRSSRRNWQRTSSSKAEESPPKSNATLTSWQQPVRASSRALKEWYSSWRRAMHEFSR
jgi:hypothetical protein